MSGRELGLHSHQALESSVDWQLLDGENPEHIRVWDRMVDDAPIPDVYYRPAYVRSAARAETHRAVAVVISAGTRQVLFPFVIRSLPGGTQDAISAYGYGGLLPLSAPPNPEPRTVVEVFSALRAWAKQERLAAATVRLHPLLDQAAHWDEGRSETWTRSFTRGETIALDLGRWDEAAQRLNGMSERRRRDLKKARAALRVRTTVGTNALAELHHFRVLYRAAMSRLNASSFYYFPDAYYEQLARELGDRFMLVNLYAEDRAVSSAIFFADRDFAHYHLGASNDDGRELGAATLYITEGCEWARTRKCSQLHLGGGAQSESKLWEFKSSFGGRVFRYSYVIVIASASSYDTLVEAEDAPWPYSATRSSGSLAGSRSLISRD